MDERDASKHDKPQSRRDREREKSVNESERWRDSDSGDDLSDQIIQKLWLGAGVDLQDSRGREKVRRIYRRLVEEDDDIERRIVRMSMVITVLFTGFVTLVVGSITSHSVKEFVAWVSGLLGR